MKLLESIDDVVDIIEQERSLLQRFSSGNELVCRVVARIRPYLIDNREIISAALSKYLLWRPENGKADQERALHESNLWMALGVITSLHLRELLPLLEKLSGDIENGLVLRKDERKYVEAYRKELFLSQSVEWIGRDESV